MAFQSKAPLQKRVSSFASVEKKPVLKSDAPNPKGRIAGTVSKTQSKAQGAPKAEGTKQLTFSREAEEKYNIVLEGNFSDVPPLPRSTVRIFLSSTFSDMRAERNALARHAYPQLRDFCTELGLSFQVVDLRWGVTSEATNNHLTTKICLLELENCQKVSLGPSCIALVGNRFGFCPLPHTIDVEEFKVLMEEVSTQDLKGKEAMETWYKLDDNAIPPAYFLQPITSILTHFLDNSPDKANQRAADIAAWNETEYLLLSSIQQAAASAHKKGNLSAERLHFFKMSVTEHEARNGIVWGKDPEKHGLAFLRDMDGLNDETYGDEMGSRYIDVTKKDGKLQLDDSVAQLLANLKTDLFKVLPGSNYKNYKVSWMAGGIQPGNNESHQEYITKFCKDFVDMVKEMILNDKLAKESLIRQKGWYSIYSEALHHAHFCKLKCESFCGRQETLDKIKRYILDPNNRKPFILHAQSGAGKTSVMAMAMESVASWVPEKHVRMIRFLGTSPFTTDIYTTLRSICGQIADNTGAIMEPQGYKTMKGIAKYMPRFFRAQALKLKQPVIIFLDSLDQLAPRYDCYSCWWLPTQLPINFKLILSTLPKEHGILDSLKQILPDVNNYAEIPLLPPATSQEIINKYLNSRNRTITSEQMNLLIDTFRKSPSPLYLKLLMDQTLTWTSDQQLSRLCLPDSIRVAINNLFAQLENKFGMKVVEGALGLITVGLNGLGEIELEDALSCLDNVLVEVYKYHDPPVPGIVQIPPVLWARIRYDIKEYLVERQSQGQTTLFWYHRQFIEAAIDRYVKGDKEIQLHKTLFEYFAAETGVKRDITLTQRRGLHIPAADRNTTPQPMKASNVRKLECMTHHLKHCAQSMEPEAYKQKTYCNLMFLRSKAASIGFNSLVQEMEDFLKLHKDPEIESVLGFVKLYKDALLNQINCAFGVLAYLPSNPQHPSIEYLRQTALTLLQNTPKTLLIPTFAFLAPREGEPTHVYDGMALVLYRQDNFFILANKWGESSDGDRSVTLAWLDITTAEMTKCVCDDISCVPCLTADGQALLYVSGQESAVVKMSASGQQTSTPLTDIVGSLSPSQNMHLSLSHCHITGSADSKYLLLSIGNDIFSISYPSLKKVGSYSLEGERVINNLHHCSGYAVTSGLLKNKDKDAAAQGFVSIINLTSSKVVDFSEIEFEILPNMSFITTDQDYHVCFGKRGDKFVIELRKVKLGEKLDSITLDSEVKGLKMSSSESFAMIQGGESALSLLNIETQKLAKCLTHSQKIVVFDVNWEDETLVVIDASGCVTLYTMTGKVLDSRQGMFNSSQEAGFCQGQIMILVDNKVKMWSQIDFFAIGSAGETKSNEESFLNQMVYQSDVRCFAISHNGQEMATVGDAKVCKLWSHKENTLTRQFPVRLTCTEIYLVSGDKLILFDASTKMLHVHNSLDGSIICDNIAENIVCMTLTKSKDEIIFIAMESKPVVYKYDIKSNSSSRKFAVNLNFTCDIRTIHLTQSQRYAVLKAEITAKDFKAIETMWKKGGNLSHQRHPYRFVAVDLSQSSGAPLQCFQRLTKVPHLGVTAEPYFGNSMMLTTRRWVIFWDIPTGICDQFMCKTSKKTKMYRPDWVGQASVGSNEVVRMSPDQKFVAVGSQDGYMFVYLAESGMPVGMKAPDRKHQSPVVSIAINSSSSLIASTCTSGILMLWEPGTGDCLFSTSLGMEVGQLSFTHDGTKLVAVTAAEKSHLMVFNVKIPR